MLVTNKKTAAIIVIALIIVLCLCYVVYVLYNDELFSSYYQMAVISTENKNYSSAISDAEKAMFAASNNQEIANVSFLLAGDLWVRNQNTDRRQAVSVYTQIINNQSMSSKTRAYAYNLVAYNMSLLAVDDPQLKEIFASPPYDAYLSQTNGDINQALYKLYAASDALYPTALANFEMARISAGMLFNQGANPADKTQLQVATTIRQQLAVGDSLLGSLSTSTNSSDQLSKLYFDRALSYWVASIYFPDISQYSVQSSFEQAIAIANSSPNDALAHSFLLLEHLLYAAYLNTQQNSGAEQAKIKSLLATFGSTHDMYTDGFLLSVYKRPSNNPLRQEVEALIQISPVLASYTQQLKLSF